ncbi:hypothetical protein A3C57_01370 [Candidatus Nomurabacteria bacterium RIFCSPHIGHO2_02_FULL_33_12]|uniref:DUF4015 domain-containing protein n=1 Tax=Candidatus Nomurabacteria bacterium RIFCSPLOWO2_01_FULL_33_17 TaxID=1801764 RepID=A0A1F6WQ98_9BACT|nr:MAG: hypothetical protein A3C57_01370 [Candidatus Nomurabacteria bacterium RIFCSPHIGHO2_02_FULL_33_12]OGI84058.1 MAG: hypothetical protein A2903_01855 [Candidatus Nomurabacteria bacterium RIFCSPLOWO2_01_FULL_33_17]
MKEHKIHHLIAISGFVLIGVFFIFGTLYSKKTEIKIIKQEQKDILELNKKYITKPIHVKGIYMSSWVAGTKSVRDNLTILIYKTEINSVVIDFKDSTGIVSIPAQIDATIDRKNAQSNRVINLKDYIQELHDNDVYVIARIACFQDPIYSKNHINGSVQNLNGSLWVDKHNLSWVDPANKDFQKYILDLSIEAYDLGFDEINLDYIRYPTDGSIHKVFPISMENSQQNVIKQFVIYMHDNLKNKNIPLSISVFGQIVSDKNDMGIGQYYEDLLPYVDSISPMIYPSHFYKGYKDLINPEKSPYDTIYFSLKDAIYRRDLLGVDTEIRPWLQDFSLAVSYNEKEVEAQIKAANDLGIYSFLLWDPKNHYTEEALKVEFN